MTIIRDKATGVPHITGTTRSGTKFGAGYAAAQDRLWLMDLFRHVGRGQLTALRRRRRRPTRALEQSFWRNAPYTEADLQAQIDTRSPTSGARGAQALADAQRLRRRHQRLHRRKSDSGRYFPGEYVLTGHIDAITNAGEPRAVQAHRPGRARLASSAGSSAAAAAARCSRRWSAARRPGQVRRRPRATRCGRPSASGTTPRPC